MVGWERMAAGEASRRMVEDLDSTFSPEEVEGESESEEGEDLSFFVTASLSLLPLPEKRESGSVKAREAPPYVAQDGRVVGRGAARECRAREKGAAPLQTSEEDAGLAKAVRAVLVSRRCDAILIEVERVGRK